MSDFATAKECRVLRCASVRMRDGVHLSTTVFLPPDAGPWPVVLVRTAYNRTGVYDPFFPRHGLVLVTQDCRGRYDSEGEHYPFVCEPADGVDTIEWIVRQPWCDGQIGMYGDSYLAATQFAAVVGGSRHLRALNPRFMSGDCWRRAYYCGGAFSLALTWTWLCFECAGRTSQASLLPRFDVQALLRTLPIAALDVRSGAGRVPAYRDYVAHSCYDDHWKPLNLRDQYARFDMPVLFTGGWYDNYAAEAVDGFLSVRRHAATDKLRQSHRLLLGPWMHGVNPARSLGEVDFGEDSVAENDATLRWLDCILHGHSAEQFQAAPVRIFVMGANRWRDEYEWPLARTRFANWYLDAGGSLRADTAGDGGPDGYQYDPRDPVPNIGGNNSIGPYNPGLWEFCKAGPYDQRAIERRDDVLVYTSAPLDDDLEVTGPVVMKLYAATSARDTDWVARLTDVHPDGRSINITEGIVRARFRDDLWGQPSLVEPGRVYEYTIDLQVTSNVFRKGHRLRLHVTSSSFPMWSRNQNTGNDPATDTDLRVADQRVYHDRTHPSHLVLPVVSG